MKKFFCALCLILTLNFSLGEGVDKAAAALEKGRREYTLKAEEISKKRLVYLAKIESLNSEISKLEVALKDLRASACDTGELAKLASKKAQDFELLRARVNSNLGGFSDSGELSYSQNLFLEDISKLFDKCQGEIFSEKIFEKLLSGEDLKKFKSSDFRAVGGDFTIDPTLGKLRSARQAGLLDEIEAGGIWMYPILAFGLAALIVAIAKSFVIFGASRLPKALEEGVDILAGAGDAEALKLANSAPKPYRKLLVSFVKNRKLEPALLEESAYEHMLSAGDKLYSGVGFLSVTAAVAPLLGLLGTVTGIIKTFSDLSIYGAGNPVLMSGGISEALITTEYGLVVAIPAFIVNALLSRRAKAILSDMEKISSSFLSKSKV